jgi:hypothetical protein
MKKSFADSNLAKAVREAARTKVLITNAAEEFVTEERLTKISPFPLKNAGAGNSMLWNGIAAQAALHIDETDPADRLLADVFSYCSLDSRKPYHWRILLEAVVGTTMKSGGAHETWTEHAFFEMQIDIERLKAIEPSARNDSRIAELLRTKKPFRIRYEKFQPGYLRKVVGQARKAEFNPYLGYQEGDDLSDFIVSREKNSLGLSEKSVRIYLNGVRDELIENGVDHIKNLYQRDNLPFSDEERSAISSAVEKLVDDFMAKNPA